MCVCGGGGGRGRANGDNLEMSFRSSTKQMYIECTDENCLHDLILMSTNNIQSNLNSSNTGGSSTMANSNSVLSPYEILPIVQEKKIGKFSYFIMNLYVASTH